MHEFLTETPKRPDPDMPALTAATRPRTASTPPWAALLGWFYSRNGLPLPRFAQLKGDEVPPPYQALLVHSSDMTPTLEKFYRQAMRLTVMSRERQGESYLREVLLTAAEQNQPVEYGVIRVCLGHLPPVASQRVLAEQRPLGNILQSEAIPHLSWPQAFFRVASDSHMEAALRLGQPAVLYGRRNVLLDASRRLLAEVIEVLAPVNGAMTNAQ